MEIRIAASGLPDDEYRKIPFLLKWIHVRGIDSVHLTHRNELADLLLVDKNHPGPWGQPPEEPEATVPEDATVLAFPQDSAGMRPACDGLSYPIRVVDLERCLKTAIEPRSELRASQSPGRKSPDKETRKAAPGASSNPAPGPAARNVDQLIETLHAEELEGGYRLEGAEHLDITAIPGCGYYHSPVPPREWALYAKDLSRAYWTALPDFSSDDPATWYPMKQLVWLLAYCGARDGLLPRIPQEAAFTLKNWPDFQFLRLEENNLRIWAYLRWHAADAKTISEETGVDLGQVVGSINAGYLCGQVQISENPDTDQTHTSQDQKTGILNKIRKRLGLGSARD
jgi:hypothetical protein